MEKYPLLLLFIFLFACKTNAPLNQTSIHIPVIEQIVIDGEKPEWKNAFTFELVSNELGRSVPEDDYSIEISLAALDSGIVLFAEVFDDTIYTDIHNPWSGDGIEFFIADSLGSNNLIQIGVSAPLDTLEKDEGVVPLDFRKGSLRSRRIEFECKRKVSTKGYSIEFFFHYNNLFTQSDAPNNVAIQIFGNDYDKRRDKENVRYKWHYSNKVHSNTYAMYPVKITEKSTTAKPDIKTWIVDESDLYISVTPVSNIELFTSEGIRIPEKIIKNTGNKLIIPFDSIAQFPYIYIYDNQLNWTEKIYTGLVPLQYVHLPKPNNFEDDIRAFEAMDKTHPVPENPIVFIGSSSINRWHTLEEDMKGLPVINRGFGGSKATDALHFIHRIVIPYNPSKIVYYEGDNDIATGVSPKEFIDTTYRFIQIVKKQLSHTKIYLLSVKPSIRRLHLWDVYSEANNRLEKLADTTEMVYYIDVAEKMFYEDGSLNEEIFVEDGVHMNADGYRIWTEIIHNTLIK